jgi:hypothetical protein
VRDDVAALLRDKVALQKSVDGLLGFDVYAYVEGRDPWPSIGPVNQEAELSATNHASD